MFGNSIKVSRGLHQKLKEIAEVRGYSSAEEFAVHVLERAVADAEDPASEEELKTRLKGLGYLE
jgi:hypothetical protein